MRSGSRSGRGAPRHDRRPRHDPFVVATVATRDVRAAHGPRHRSAALGVVVAQPRRVAGRLERVGYGFPIVDIVAEEQEDADRSRGPVGHHVHRRRRLPRSVPTGAPRGGRGLDRPLAAGMMVHGVDIPPAKTTASAGRPALAADARERRAGARDRRDERVAAAAAEPQLTSPSVSPRWLPPVHRTLRRRADPVDGQLREPGDTDLVEPGQRSAPGQPQPADRARQHGVRPARESADDRGLGGSPGTRCECASAIHATTATAASPRSAC